MRQTRSRVRHASTSDINCSRVIDERIWEPDGEDHLVLAAVLHLPAVGGTFADFFGLLFSDIYYIYI